MIPPGLRRGLRSAQVLTFIAIITCLLFWALYRDGSKPLEALGHTYDYPVLPSPQLPEVYADLLPGGKIPRALRSAELAPLAQRLQAFLERPVWSHDESLSLMTDRCPPEVSDLLVNPDQLNGDGDFWKHTVDRDEVVRRRVQVVDWLRERVEQGRKILGDAEEGGRGIVLTAGNQVSSTIRVFRQAL